VGCREYVSGFLGSIESDNKIIIIFSTRILQYAKFITCTLNTRAILSLDVMYSTMSDAVWKLR
jgi:hypothetical protein